MLILPTAIMALLVPCAPLFSARVWRHVPLLVAGAILAPGRRMVSSVLRVVGWDQLATFQTDHRVLNGAVWSSLGNWGASRILFGLLVNTFAPAGPLVVGLDETTRAAPRQEDWRKRHLPRPRPLEPQPPRQGPGPALDLRHPAGPHPLGTPGMGAALPDGARPVGACGYSASAPAVQAPDHLGTPDDPPGAPLGA